MGHTRSHLYLTIFLCLGFCPALALAASWCQPERAPEIYVGLQASTPKSNFTLSMAELENFQIDTESPYEAHIDTHVGGLTVGGIKVEQQIQLGGASLGAQTCLWVNEVRVVIRLDQTVYVAREHPPGTCMNQSIWDHEHKHIRVDRHVMNAYRPVFEAAIIDTLRQRMILGPLGPAQVQAAQESLQNQINDAVKAVTDQMQADRQRRQQAVDTLEEYERVARSCS